MPESTKLFDPPDADLTALAAEINKKTRSGRVSFFSKAGDVSVIFAEGPRRRLIPLDGRPTDGDIDAIVVALESWAGFRQEGSAYSIEVPPLPESGW
jgi:hypothetical protein